MEPSTMEPQENLAQNLSIPDFKNLMETPLLKSKSISQFHVFSKPSQESERTKPASNFSNSITKEKIRKAMELFNLAPFPTLVQFWAPTIAGENQQLFLDASELPFGLNFLRKGLCLFRKRSSGIRYCVDGDACGPPGRAFRRRFPEFCPDVRCYSVEEFVLKESAKASDVRGYWCVPVFEPGWQCCIGVLEILTIWDGSFGSTNVIDKVSDSLKEVGLRSSDVFWPFDTKLLAYNHSKNGPPEYELALSEIQNVLDVLCKTYSLPFAQTWVVTLDESSKESIMSTAKMGSCMSTIRVSSFRRDCIWFHLRKGQGIVWKAFLSGTPCFCRDITKISIVDYALVLSARKADLTGGFAICLQSSLTGTAVFIIELFLPPNLKICSQPWKFLTSLLVTMKQQFKTFKLSSGQEVGDELPVSVLKISKEDPLDSFIICQTMHAGEGLKNEGHEALQKSCQPLMFEVEANKSRMNYANAKENIASSSFVFECSRNGEMVQAHDATIHNRRNELNARESIFLRPTENGATKTLSLGETISIEVIEEQSGERLTNTPDNLSVNKSMSNRRAQRKRNKVDFSFIQRKSMKKTKQHMVESCQQHQSCYVSPQEESPASISSLSPAATPIHSEISVMTVKAEFEGDTIKFQVPVASGIKKLKDEVMKRLKLTAGSFQIKYHHEDRIWLVLDSDAGLQQYVNAVRSLGRSTIKLSIVSAVPQTERMENALVESHQQDQSCYVSPQEESPASISSLSPAATPIQYERRIMTVKAEFEGDTIKFQVPVASGIKKLKDEVMKRLKLTAGSFQIKYHHEDSVWIVLDSDAGLQQYVNAIRSLGISTIKLSIVSAVPQTEAMENAMVESHQEDQSWYVSPQEESPASISSLSPAATPIHNERSIMTVKAEFEGDTIKFQVPVASGIKKLKDEVMKRLKLTAGSFQIKYHHEDSIWIVLDSDAGLQECVNAIRSSGISTIKLSIVSIVPQAEAMENAMVESRQQHHSWYVSPQEENPASISSLPPAATPIQNERSVMTVKAEFEGDTIKFHVPVASGIKKLKDEVMKRLKLTAGSFQIKYHHEDSIWIVLDSDAGLQECVNAIRSSGISTIKLSIVSIVPQAEAMENAMVESRQQHQSWYVSPQEESPASISSLPPAATPIQNERSVMTVKAEFEGDTIKFHVPVASGIKKLKDEVMKRLKLTAGNFQIKYHHEDSIWIVLDSDAGLQEYVNAIRSSGISTIKLFIVSIVPQAEAMENAMVESRQQHQSWYVSPQEESPASISSLSPAATPIQNERSVMTVKAEFEGDTIKFQVPVACGIKKLKDEVMKRLKLTAGSFQIKYHHEDSIWIVLDSDAGLREYVNAIRSSGISTIKLSIVSIVPQTERMENALVESHQQDQSCYVSPQEESPASISSLSPAATPIQNERSVMTVKAEFEGDTIKFQVPVASGIKKLKDEVMKRLKLTAGSFQIKYHHEDSIWIVLDSDAGLREYVNAIRSSGISTIKLSIVSIVPQTERMENALVESHQQDQSCYVSPQEESPASISSLSPAATPIHNERSIMTVKAEFEGDTIKFQVPVASGIKKLKDEVMKRLKLTAGSFQIKYHHEDSIWIVLDSDAGLQQYVNAVRSSGISTIKLSIVSAVPQTEAMENAMVESRQQHQSCYVSPQEESPTSISSLSPAAIPIIERSVMTVKAEFEGDTIKFQVPVASGIKKLKDEVMKRLKLTAGSFQIKYHHEDSVWIVLDSDAGLQQYVNAIRSLGISTIKLSIVSAVPQTEAMENAMVESRQQHQTCYVSPQEEGPASISSLSPAAIPIIERSVMTVKAEFEGDTIKFQVPVASGIKKLKDEVMKRLKLTAGSFQIKYHHEDSVWIVLDSDAGLQQYVNAIRSLGISTIKLSIVSAVPQTEAMENAMVESRQQHQTCYVSPQEEGPASISSLSPAATPIHNERHIMTVKAEFEGDTIKFQVPVASGIKKLKDEVMKRLKLTAGSFQIKYHHEDSIWIVLDSDAGLQEYMNAIRSLGINTIKLSIVNCTTN